MIEEGGLDKMLGPVPKGDESDPARKNLAELFLTGRAKLVRVPVAGKAGNNRYLNAIQITGPSAQEIIEKARRGVSTVNNPSKVCLTDLLKSFSAGEKQPAVAVVRGPRFVPTEVGSQQPIDGGYSEDVVRIESTQDPHLWMVQYAKTYSDELGNQEVISGVAALPNNVQIPGEMRLAIYSEVGGTGRQSTKDAFKIVWVEIPLVDSILLIGSNRAPSDWPLLSGGTGTGIEQQFYKLS